VADRQGDRAGLKRDDESSSRFSLFLLHDLNRYTLFRTMR
jgi:hypothetical protein